MGATIINRKLDRVQTMVEALDSCAWSLNVRELTHFEKVTVIGGLIVGMAQASGRPLSQCLQQVRISAERIRMIQEELAIADAAASPPPADSPPWC